MKPIPYQVVRSGRRTIAIQITCDGQVLVRCPYGVSGLQIQDFVESKRSWIEKHITRKPENVSLLSKEELQRLRKEGREVFLQRVMHYAPLIGVKWDRITVRFQKTRWGSCTGKGNLSFNGLLLLAPAEVLDYVVVHELCHRLEMNHPKKFWQAVASAYPNYPAARKWLREKGGALVARLGRCDNETDI